MSDPGGSETQVVKFGASVTDGTNFVHPGIFVSPAQLDFVKDQIAAGAQPWTTALANLMSFKIGSRALTSLSYSPTPAVALDRANASTTNIGMDDIAAYGDALLYAYTGNVAYADKAISIMNAWSATMKNQASSTAQLDAAWASEVFPRAAEIVRYMYTPAAGHPPSMLRTSPRC
jgi:hypothetical protein